MSPTYDNWLEEPYQWEEERDTRDDFVSTFREEARQAIKDQLFQTSGFHPNSVEKAVEDFWLFLRQGDELALVAEDYVRGLPVSAVGSSVIAALEAALNQADLKHGPQIAEDLADAFLDQV